MKLFQCKLQSSINQNLSALRLQFSHFFDKSAKLFPRNWKMYNSCVLDVGLEVGLGVGLEVGLLGWFLFPWMPCRAAATSSDCPCSFWCVRSAPGNQRETNLTVVHHWNEGERGMRLITPEHRQIVLRYQYQRLKGGQMHSFEAHLFKQSSKRIR